MLQITNATIHTPDRVIERGSVVVDGDRIVAVGTAVEAPAADGARVLDAGGRILAPGFIDVQLNGAFGHDFTADPPTIWQVAAGLPRYGVTAFLPTIITSPLEQVEAGLRVVQQGRPEAFRGAEPLGLHAEGPFLNPKKKGAHNERHLRLPTPEAVADWSPASGMRLVTMAPELPGALEVIRALVARGVVVSTGHSMATFEEAVAGFDAGARYGTHLFNAMPSLGHRDLGLPGALLADGTLAGSILELDQALRNLIEIAGCTLGEALETMTTTPARLLGMEQERGRIAPGFAADAVLLSPDLKVQTTIASGEVVYPAPR
jgi:N-acetylglucosamine-6-phosphate deacetylase